MQTIDRDIERILALLRNLIQQQGFTQLEVQKALGWGRSYISQLLTRQKSLRAEQLLSVLDVIDVDPADFWGEIYRLDEIRPRRQTALFATADVGEEIQQLGMLFEGLVAVMKEKKLITTDDLATAIEKSGA